MMLHRHATPWMILFTLVAVASCGSDDVVTCTDRSVYGLHVIVVNGLDTAGQCDVSVTAVDGNYSETLECGVEETTCVCRGAAERQGTYHLTAYRSDGASTEATVTVGRNTCHVAPASVTLTLP